MNETWRYASRAARFRLVFAAAATAAACIGLVWTDRHAAAAAVVLLTAAAEGLAYGFVRASASRPGGLAMDPPPPITEEMVERFYEHGYDPELGWTRKANTAKKDLGKYAYCIDARGSRCNPGHEDLTLMFSTYGDSYTFCREVEDHETWQWFLAEETHTNVLNFGVGNYGLDQTLLRLRREWPSNRTPVVIIGIVPQSIGRNLSVWKHYNEFGNLLAFKPRFLVDGGRLRLVPNPVDTREKYFQLASLLPSIQATDYFYARRFKTEAFRFPFLASMIVNWRAVTLILAKAARRAMKRVPFLEEHLSRLIAERLDTFGVRQTVALFRDPDAMDLLEGLAREVAEYARMQGFVPVLALLPMKDDWLYMKRHGHFYEAGLERLRRHLMVVDAAPRLLNVASPRALYRDWHYSPGGNRIVASVIAEAVKGCGDPDAGHAWPEGDARVRAH